MQTSILSQNMDFLKNLLNLCFPDETHNALIIPPDIDFSIKQAPNGCHLKLYVSPMAFTNQDQDIISSTPFLGYLDAHAHDICQSTDNPKSEKYWEQVLYLPGISLYVPSQYQYDIIY